MLENKKVGEGGHHYFFLSLLRSISSRITVDAQLLLAKLNRQLYIVFWDSFSELCYIVLS